MPTIGAPPIMPNGPKITGGPKQTVPKKQRLRRAPSKPAETKESFLPQQARVPGIVLPESLGNKLDAVEKWSAQKLPTDLSLAIAQNTLDKQSAGEVARGFVKKFDIPYESMFEAWPNTSGQELFLDPTSGLPMTAARAQQLANLFGPEQIKTMIKTAEMGSVPQARPGAGRNRGRAPKLKTVDPSHVSAAFEMISYYIDPDELNATEAAAFSIMAAQNLKGDQWGYFQKNLEKIKELGGDINEHPPLVIQMAMAATQGIDTDTYVIRNAGDINLLQAIATGQDTSVINTIAANNKKSVDIASQLAPPTVDIRTKEQVEAGEPIPTAPNPTGAPVTPLEIIETQTTNQRQYNELVTNITTGDAASLSAIHKSWDDSWLGKRLQPAGDAYNRIVDTGSGVIYGAATFVGEVARIPRVALDEEISYDDWRNQIVRNAQHTQRILSGDESMAEALIAEGAPPTMAAVAELAGMFASDPTFWGGGIVKGIRVGRFLSGTNRSTKMIESFVEGSKGASWFVTQARGAEHQLALSDKINATFRFWRQARQFDPRLTDEIFNIVKTADRMGFDDTEVLQMVKGSLYGAMGANTDVGKLHEVLTEINRTKQLRAGGYKPHDIGTEGIPYAEPWALTEDAERLGETLYQALNDMGVMGRQGFEAFDEAGNIIKFGTKTRVFLREVPTKRLLSYGAAVDRVLTHMPPQVRQTWKALGSKLSSLVLNMESPSWGDDVTQMLRRAGVHSDAEISEYLTKAYALSSGGAPNRSARLHSFLDAMENDMLTRIATKNGLSPDDAAKIIAELKKKQKTTQAILFGVAEDALDATVAEGRPVTLMNSPQFETQLPNARVMLDPAKVNTMMKQAVGMGQELKTYIARLMGDTIPVAQRHDYTARLLAGQRLEWAADAYLRAWKPAVVMTPRYILRVPLGDEQMRFIADVGLWERIKSGKAYSSAMRRMGKDPGYWTLKLGPDKLERLNEAVVAAGLQDSETALRQIKLVQDGVVLSPAAMDQLDNLPDDVRGVLETLAKEGEVPAGVNPWWENAFGPNAATDLTATGQAKYTDDALARIAAVEQRYGEKSIQATVARIREEREALGLANPKGKIEDVGRGTRDGGLTHYDVGDGSRMILGRNGEIYGRWSPNRKVILINEDANWADSAYSIAWDDQLKYNDLYQTEEMKKLATLDHERGHVVWDQLSKNRTLYREFGMRLRAMQARGVAQLPGAKSKAIDDFTHEAFADGYSLFKNSPDVLERDMPELFDFFTRYESTIDNTISRAIYRVEHLGRDFAPVGDLKLRVSRRYPGEIMDERLVNSGKMADWFRTVEQEQRSLLGRMAKRSQGGAHHYGKVWPGDKHYASTLEEVLRHQVGYSAIGQRLLRGVRDGTDPQKVMDDIVEFLTKDQGGQNLAEELGLRTAADIEDHVEGVAAQVRGWVDNDPNIALAVIEDDRGLAAMLAGVDRSKQLPVHGFMFTDATAGKGGGSALLEGYSKLIFELPTNRLVRQPYFKHWYTKVEDAMMNQAIEMGIGVTDDLRNSIQSVARQFATERTLQIMFDFRKSSRFAELARFVAPFLQPYAEAFSVWGHLLQQNPAFAAQIRLLGGFADDIGLLEDDPITGETRIGLSAFAFGAPLLNMAFGGGGGDLPGWSLSGPLSSLNFVFGSTFQLPTGSLAGMVPLPVPSLSPPMTWLMQKFAGSDFVPDGMKFSMINWAFQYGSLQTKENFVQGLLPNYLTRFVSSFGESSELNSMADDFIKLYQTRGLTPQSYAKQTGITVDEAETFLADKAKDQARDLMRFKAFYSWIFPIAPSVSYPTQELETEFQLKVQELGDYTKARDFFLEKYPEYSYITLSSTVWRREGVEIPIPANQAIDELLRQDGVKEFAEANPRWVFALIPDEAWEAGFDRTSFFKQIDEGWRVAKTPDEFYDSADQQFGWEAWRSATDIHDAQVAWLEENNVSGSSNSAQAIDLDYKETVEAIKRLYPGFAVDYETTSNSGVNPKVLQDAYAMLQVPMFAETQVGKALREYLKVYEAVETDMADLNIHNIDTKMAEEEGITAGYDAAVAKIIEQVPRFEQVYNLYFDRAHRAVMTRGDELLNALTPEQRANFLDWDVRFGTLKEEAGTAINSADSSVTYLELRDMSNQTWSAYPTLDENPQYIWWNTLDPREQEDYASGVTALPYSFMSRFDREVVLGDETSDSAEAAWLDLGTIQATISRINHDNPEAETGGLYDQMNAKALAYASVDPVFAAQLEKSNTWGYSFQRYFEDWTVGDHPSAQAWSQFFDQLSFAQSAVDSIGSHGTSDFDQAKAVAYQQIRNELEKVVLQLKEESPQFKDDWDRFEKASGFLLERFMPDTYYRLGVI